MFKQIYKKNLDKIITGKEVGDEPPNFLMDSTVSPRGANIGRIRSWGMLLARNTLGVKGCARVSGWGLGRVTSKLITHTDSHKPNKKLVSA
jgi:hypothetical protein